MTRTRDGHQLVHLVIPLSLYRQARRLAARENVTISEVVRRAMAELVARELGVEVTHAVQRGGYRPPVEE